MESTQTDSRSISPGGADQARLRRERREAKIRAGGAARLDKITSMGGRPPEATCTTPPTSATQPPVEKGSESPADLVDLNQAEVQEQQIRQMMLGVDGPPPGFSNPTASPDVSQEALFQMMQQMLGSHAGVPPPQANAGSGVEGLGQGFPQGDLLAQMLGAGQGMNAGPMGQSQQAVKGGEDAHAYLWKIVHALFALALGLYVAISTSFSGSFAEREAVVEYGAGHRLFWIFATGELVLQSSRFLLEEGSLRSTGGVLGLAMTVLPEPWKNRVGVLSRYGAIYTTLMSDVMLIVFILGVTAWLNQR